MPPRDDADDARGEIVMTRERGALFFEKRDEPLRDVPEADENQIDGHRDATVPEMGVAPGCTLLRFLSANVHSVLDYTGSLGDKC